MQLCCVSDVVVAAAPPQAGTVVMTRYQLVGLTSKLETISRRIASNSVVVAFSAPPRPCTAYRLRLVSLTGCRKCRCAPFRLSIRLTLSFYTTHSRFAALLFSLPCGNHAGTSRSWLRLANFASLRLEYASRGYE